MIARLYLLREQWRILRYRIRASSDVGFRKRVGEWQGVIGGVVYLVVATILDHLVVPRVPIAPTPSGSNEMDWVLATVAALTGLLALAVSVSTTPLAAALERFSPSVAVPLLVDESRDRLLRFVIGTFTLSVGLLSLEAIGWDTPVAGSVLAGLLGVRVLTLLAAYIRERVALLHPTALGSMVASQMGAWLRQGANWRPSPSVTRYLQRRFRDNFRLLIKMCVLQVEHRLEEEATDILIQMTGVVSAYMKSRRYLDPNGEWFPTRQVPVSGFDLFISPMYEQLALGTPMRTERHADWFEEQVASSWLRLSRAAAEAGANQFALALVESIKRLMVEAVEQQELAMLERLCDVAEGLAQHVESIPAVTELVNAVLLLDHALAKGFQVQQARVAAETTNYAPQAIRNENLPTITSDQLTRMGERLRNERLIETVTITPGSQAERQLVAALRSEEQKVRSRFRNRMVAILEHIGHTGQELGGSPALPAAVGGLVLLAERHLERNETEQAIDISSKIQPFAHALAGPGDGNGEPRDEVTERIRVLVARALGAHVADISINLVPILIARFMDSGQPEQALAIAALAHLRAEIAQDQRYSSAAEVGLTEAGVDVAGLAQDVLQRTNGRRPLVSLAIEMQYHNHMLAFRREIEQMPTRIVTHPGSQISDEVPDHPSRLVQRMGFRVGLLSVDDCVQAFLESVQASHATPESEQ